MYAAPAVKGLICVIKVVYIIGLLLSFIIIINHSGHVVVKKKGFGLYN